MRERREKGNMESGESVTEVNTGKEKVESETERGGRERARKAFTHRKSG